MTARGVAGRTHCGRWTATWRWNLPVSEVGAARLCCGLPPHGVDTPHESKWYPYRWKQGQRPVRFEREEA